MRTLAALALLLFALPSSAAEKVIGRWTDNQTLTETAPTTGSDQGVSLVGASGWRLIACAASAQAITGGGLVAWVQFQAGVTKLWAETPRLEPSLTLASSSQRCQSLGEFPVAVSAGRLYVTAKSVTVSGGTTVDLYIEVFYR